MFTPQPMGTYHFYGPAPGSEGFVPLPTSAPSGPPHPTPSSPVRPSPVPSPVKRPRGRPPKIRAAAATAATGSSPVPSPSPSPVKRPRGRPPKDRAAAATAAKVATAKTKVATSKAKAKKSKAKTSSKNEKENQPVAPIEVDDSSDSEVEGKIPWKHEEKSKLFTWMLAFDDNGNKRFEQLKKNPARVFKRAEEVLFPGKRTKKSIQNIWSRSLETYGWIRAFEGFTGNGGGDPDSDNPTAVLAYRLKGARTASVAIGNLKPETITVWEAQGWLELFGALSRLDPNLIVPAPREQTWEDWENAG
ncbi:hypothetical protein B0H16DRAFT_1721767 [Mycena metata]|uniref:Uncharacterized protein n=1 Tax=Mycena metata TaxID=1033252 RepID=A0AAD7J6J6_9AGAR|nr:hypothetical protein B0H16DRAFT_1721767 [Mycena metata]